MSTSELGGERSREDPTELMEELFDGAVQDVVDAHGVSTLIAAIRLKKKEILRELLRKGLDPGMKDANGWTALTHAALDSGDGTEGMIDILLEAGADPNDVTNDCKWTALMFAARNGSAEDVRSLIRYGADVNARSDKGETALMFAAQYGRERVVLDLIAAGADIDVQTDEGASPLMCAAWNGHVRTAESLLSEGADMGARTKAGETALHLAWENESPVQHLLISWMERVKLKEETSDHAEGEGRKERKRI